MRLVSQWLERSQAPRGSGATGAEATLTKACTETPLCPRLQNLPLSRLPLGQQVKLQRREALRGPVTWALGSEGAES